MIGNDDRLPWCRLLETEVGEDAFYARARFGGDEQTVVITRSDADEGDDACS